MKRSLVSILGVVLLLRCGVRAQPNDDDVYANAVFAMNLFQVAVRRLSCQISDDDSEFFSPPSPCLSGNVTKETCPDNCCYLDNNKLDGQSMTCVKRQRSSYIIEKLYELKLLTNPSVNGNQKKQGDLQAAVASFISCVSNGDVDCQMVFNDSSANAQIIELVVNSLPNNETNNETAQQLLVRLGPSVIETLLSIGVITADQAANLTALFGELGIVTETIEPTTMTPSTLPGSRLSIGCFWHLWSAWSNCQGVCGVGIISRFRRCQNCVPGTGGCIGACVEKRRCANPIGQICGYWSGWTPFGACSTSCGPGVAIRRRSCYGGNVGDVGCEGVTQESIVCNTGLEGNGRLLPWGPWSPCTSTCGGGRRTRRQAHTCFEQQSQLETQICNSQPPYGPWTRWSVCSTSCGPGFEQRTRTNVCPNIPIERETQPCNLGSGFWSDWAPWGSCSMTCPGGFSFRRRSNPCFSADEEEQRSCGDQGEWTPWSPFGPCSTSCPGGIQERTRRHTCLNEVQRQEAMCGMLFDFSPWTEFSQCSSSCIGRRVRQRFNPCLEPQREEETCGSDSFWTAWSPYGMCSQTCSGGTQTRTRMQPCTGRNESENRSCGGPGAYGDYSQWSACSATCGEGTRTRFRIHSCPNLPGIVSPLSEEEVCSLQDCCAFGEWSAWSDCPATCNYGVINRQRTNNCSTIAPIVERMFCQVTSGVWSNWSPWSLCPETCLGTQVRTRTQSCFGEQETQTRYCGELIYREWSEWSQCSRSCGGGMQTRYQALACDPTAVAPRINQSRECNTDPGRYIISDWTPCSAVCRGQGSRTRSRTHTCDLPSTVQRDNECGIVGDFLPWSEWSGCSQSCFGGISMRRRRHQCTNELQMETLPCGSPGIFLDWTLWSVCSQRCAGGTRSRSRRNTCTDPQVENQNCGSPPFYGEWSMWSSCTQTCGTGTRTRNRQGFCGNQNEQETTECSIGPCCFLTEWQSWGPCSVSCFEGQRIRERFTTCSPTVPADSEIENCNAGSGVTSPWTEWEPCSVECGGGFQRRSRNNTCSSDPTIEERPCNTQRCIVWSTWTPWSTCSATCFMGVIVRTRVCSGGIAGQDCLGNGREQLECSAPTRTWNSWTTWTICTATCGGGIQTRQRDHPCGLPREDETQTCNTDPGVFLSWSFWSVCTRTCRGGVRNRERRQTCTGFIDTVSEPCNTSPGFWTTWNAWTVCSSSCGGGTRSRTRSHTCGLDDELQRELCNTQTGVYSDWSLWSACSRSCGGGTRTRLRTHSCGLPNQNENEACATVLCPRWSPWTAWGACSASCENGLQIRTRVCVDGIAGVLGCLGQTRQERICAAPLQDDGPWMEFSSCTVTCGGGRATRTRVNPCTGLQSDSIECNTDPGRYTEWEPWGPCTATCGGGSSTRRRSHTCGLPDLFDTIPCNTDPGTWSNWSNWTSCSATCGFGTRSRERFQSCTGERERPIETCFLHPCAIWGGWTTWGPCSSSCGLGTSVRSRNCQGGPPGEGFCFTSIINTTEGRECDSGPCCDFAWSGWSACCRIPPPPAVTRDIIQLRYQGNGCGEPWRLANRTCPPGVRIVNAGCNSLALLFEEADIHRLEPVAGTNIIRFRENQVSP